MNDLFKDILNMTGVRGVILLSFQGDVLFQAFNAPPGRKPAEMDWRPVVQALLNIREADLIYEELRLYTRKTPAGYLVIAMEPFGPAAMVRLNCDLLLPELKKSSSARGLKGLFKRKRSR